MMDPSKANDAGIKHYRIRMMDDGKRCYINPKRPFDTVVELIEHYKRKTSQMFIESSEHMLCFVVCLAVEQDGLCCRLGKPCPKEPEAVPFKDIEVNRSAIKMQTKLGAGMFGEVWKGSWWHDVMRLVGVMF